MTEPQWTKGAYCRWNDPEKDAELRHSMKSMADWIDLMHKADCLCLVGWCYRVYGDTPERLAALDKIQALVPEYQHPAYFNDDPETTFEMVLDITRRADV